MTLDVTTNQNDQRTTIHKGVIMSEEDQPAQLGRLDVQRLAKTPGALDKARLDGRLDDLLAGRNPGDCPTCGRAMADPK